MCPINMVLMSLAAAISSAATLVGLEFCLYHKYMMSVVPLYFRPAGMGGMSLLLGTAESFSGKSALARMSLLRWIIQFQQLTESLAW
jgi:hypothetical protein